MTVVGYRRPVVGEGEPGEGKSLRQRRSYGARVGTGMSYVIFLRDILTGVPRVVTGELAALTPFECRFFVKLLLFCRWLVRAAWQAGQPVGFQPGDPV